MNNIQRLLFLKIMRFLHIYIVFLSAAIFVYAIFHLGITIMIAIVALEIINIAGYKLNRIVTRTILSDAGEHIQI